MEVRSWTELLVTFTELNERGHTGLKAKKLQRTCRTGKQCLAWKLSINKRQKVTPGAYTGYVLTLTK